MAENDLVNYVPYDNIGATVNLNMDDETDLMAIHHLQESNFN